VYVDFLWVKVSGEGWLIGRGGGEGSESETSRDIGQLATKVRRNRKCCSVLCVDSVWCVAGSPGVRCYGATEVSGSDGARRPAALLLLLE
jgi:hypothetical protein